MPTASRRAKTPLAALVLVGTVLALLLGGAGPASAHAIVTRSDPADVSVLKTAPKQVTLTFNEAVRLADGSLRVLSPKNLRVDRGSVQHAAGKTNTARVRLTDKLPEGTYTVSWRVVSSDSHPISGAFTFSIGEPSPNAATVPAESRPDTSLTRPYGFFRYVAYGALALLIGIALFTLHCWPASATLRPLRKLLLTGWAALFASTIVLLLLRGPYESGKSLTAVLDLSLLGRTLMGRSGLALGSRLVLVMVAGVLLALFAVRLRREADRQPSRAASGSAPTDQPAEKPQSGIGVHVVGALLAVGLALTWAAAEHASAGLHVPLAIPVAVLHLLAMAVWLGGLVALVVALFPAPAHTVIPAAAVARFSRLAFAAVVVLVTTGIYQSWRQVGSVEALSTTEYGRLLVFKSIAVVLVLTVAASSRRWTAQLIQEHPPKESVSAAEPHPVPAAQTVGAGASTAVGGASTAESSAPYDSADGPDSADTSSPPATDHHRRALRRSVAVEALLGVVVLAITTLLTGTQPSRAATQSAAALAAARAPAAQVAVIPFDTGTPNGNGRVQITFLPGRVGDNTVEILLFGADGGVIAVPELQLTLTQHAQRIGPLDAKLINRGGYWISDRLRIPVPGTWTLRVAVRVTDIDQVTVTKNVTIKPSPT